MPACGLHRSCRRPAVLLAALIVASLCPTAEAVTWTQCKRWVYVSTMACGLMWSFVCGLLVVWYLVAKRMEPEEEPDWPEDEPVDVPAEDNTTMITTTGAAGGGNTAQSGSTNDAASGGGRRLLELSTTNLQQLLPREAQVALVSSALIASVLVASVQHLMKVSWPRRASASTSEVSDDRGECLD
mmetsp:Transcript_31334/g.73068  ORF Transcript_31334/g.73068 Transcript_31334/m.73068 type:complete len:185 (+) Transcript_31334:128-682(+)|eukprot:CAMPEP_0178406420 /NCGR_PEP_ID=MMETSP0689_2-20121128/18903_1 /TAXON_ID=160604 /ORGANISM="Amphidinium massartii, Strain CS-259" /LENGTH=184 /DNA_ID=CAMNT_0020027461 /DNA_START=38 /DNA_END=592 /DNA_ORIENTATION=+